MGNAHALTAFLAAAFLGAAFLAPARLPAFLDPAFLRAILGALLGVDFLATLVAAIFAINERTRLGFDWKS